MTGVIFDGSVNHPGCRCGDECGMPCWQRIGVAPACEQCGCDAFADDVPIVWDVLDTARNTVRGARQHDYGDPSENLRRIGIVWGSLLNIDAIPPRKVAVMLAGMKVVRAAHRTNRDDLVDGIGYLYLADESDA